MEEREQDEVNREEVEDLEVPESDADDVKGGAGADEEEEPVQT